MRVDRRRGAHRSAEKLIERLVEDLSGEVPQRDIDPADRGNVGDEGVLQRAHPVEVALDGEGILPDECLLDGLDAVARQLGVDSGFAVADQSGIRFDADQAAVADVIQLKRLDGRDLDHLRVLAPPGPGSWPATNPRVKREQS